MAPPVEINYLAVLVAAIASMALGFLWYGPLFGNQWKKQSKLRGQKFITLLAVKTTI